MELTNLSLVARLGSPLDELPMLKLLPDDVRALIVNSFVPATFPFGAVVANEGDVADAMYVVTSGRARVLRKGEDGQEIPLNLLGAGDTFGEIELLDRSPRPATVRASSELHVLRMDRSVFDGLLRTHPEVRTYFELQRKHRQLEGFFRHFPAFRQLPAQAVVAIVLAELEPVEVEAGQVVVRQGDPAGPLYLVEEGQLRVFRQESNRRRYVRRLGPGDFFGEQSAISSSPRDVTVEALSRCRLLTISEESFQRFLSDVPGFRAQITEHLDRYKYKQVANVPADFADEILPTSSRAGEKVSPDQLDDPAPDDEASEGPFAVKGRFRKRGRRIRRFPFVWQIDEMDCGAACLAMVCRYFGRAVTLARIRQLAHTAIDGTSLRALCHAASEVGLAARAVKVSPRNLAQMPLPAIVHWEGNHWVVLVDVARTHVRVADPGLGRRRLAVDEFRGKWTGYAALFDYSGRFERARPARPSLSWLWTFVRPYSGLLLRAVGLAVVVSALHMLMPVFTQVIVDRVLVEQDTALLNVLMLATIAAMLFMVAALGVQRYLASFVAVRVDTATLDFLMRRLLALPMSYFWTRRTGDLQRRLEGARQIRDFLVQHGVSALTAAVQIVAAIVLMAVYSPALTLVFVATASLYAFLMLVSRRLLRPAFARMEDAFGAYRSHQIDAIKGIETVKALGGEHGFRSLMLAQFQIVARQLFRTDLTTMSYEGGIQAVTFLTLALFLWVGAHQVLQGSLTIGGLIALNSLVAMANAPIVSLLGVWDSLQRSAVLVSRLDDVFEQEPEQGADRSRLRPVHDLEGAISLRNLGFRYGGPESAAILEGITLEIPAGTRVALVGRSGSGKTTLAKCLAGLVEPTEGMILYDGIDLTTLNHRDLRQQIGFVLQDTFLFADTIARNIALGEDEGDMERVRWAAEVANAKEFIERLPLAYETRVGESGIALSGGQRQRIAIARAIYRRPPVLILDEATSSLDSESETVVRDNLDRLLEGRTSIVIAHRLSTIRNADTIVVLENGRVAERGTHADLLQRRGLYYYLASQQLLLAEA